jgi:uncharacterized repeat protein (TIGR01451 family)
MRTIKQWLGGIFALALAGNALAVIDISVGNGTGTAGTVTTAVPLTLTVPAANTGTMTGISFTVQYPVELQGGPPTITTVGAGIAPPATFTTTCSASAPGQIACSTSQPSLGTAATGVYVIGRISFTAAAGAAGPQTLSALVANCSAVSGGLPAGTCIANNGTITIGPSNVAPTAALPSTPTILLGGTALVPISVVTPGSGTGSLTLNCSVAPGSFGIAGSLTRVLTAPATTVPDLPLNCSPSASAINGTITCTQAPSPASSVPNLSAAVVCPAAAVFPTQTFTPPPAPSSLPGAANTVALSGTAIVGATILGAIPYTSSGGVVGSPDTVSFGSCTFPPGNFSVTSPLPLVFNPGVTQSGSIGLSCVTTAVAQSANLTCFRTPNGSASLIQSWVVTCPAGAVGSISYAPAAGTTASPGTFNFPNGAGGAVGSSISAAITATGTNFISDTGTLSNCATTTDAAAPLSNPSAFSGFGALSFSVTGNNVPQPLNGQCTRQSAVNSAILTCEERIGVQPSVLRVYRVNCPAGAGGGVDLALTKSISGSTVFAVGDTIPFQFAVRSNSGSAATATGINVADILPAGLSYQGFSGTGWSCNASAGSNPVQVSCTYIGALAANTALPVLSVNAIAGASTAGNSLTNTATLSSSGADSNPGDNISSVTFSVRGTASISVQKSVQPSVIRVGEEATFTITVDNTGASDATGLVVIDDVPASLSILAISDPNCSQRGQIVDCRRSRFPAGDSFEFTLRVRAARAGNFSNRADASVAQAQTPRSANASLQVNAGDTQPPPPGTVTDITTFEVPSNGGTAGVRNVEVRVKNNSAVNAENVVLNAAPSSGSLATPAGISGCATAGAGFRCNIGALAAGAERSFSTIWRYDTAAGGRSDFSVSTSTAETNLGNNSFSISAEPAIPPASSADLSISKTVDVPSVSVGGSLTYRLSVKNLSTVTAAQQVLLSDDLPAGLSFVNATVLSGGGSCQASANGRGLRCSFASIAANASALVALATTADTASPGAINNTATVSSITPDPVAANNSSTVSSTITPLNINLGRCNNTDRNALAAIAVITQRCASGDASVAALCRALAQGDCSVVNQTLSGIAPEEVLAASLVLRDFATTQFFNVDARLSELRRGGSGLSLSGLGMQFGAGLGASQVGLGMLTNLGRAIAGAEGDAADSGDGAPMYSPWGLFVNGSLSNGDQTANATLGRVKLGFQTKGITAGVDYRLNDRGVIGAALGFGDISSDVGSSSRLNSKLTTFTAYSSWYANENFYLDGRLSYGRGSVDQQREIVLPILSSTLRATGNTDATQLTTAISAGYHYAKDAWVFTPNLFLRHIRSRIDAYTETGAENYNLRFDSQTDSSTQWGVGLQMSRAFSLSSGVLTPQLDVNYTRNQSLDGAAVEWRFATGAGGSALASEAKPDSAFGNVGLGIVYISANGKQAYLNYRRVLGYEGFSRGTINLGARFDF